MENKADTSNERVWAALAHASGLLFFFGLAPLLIWTTQRKKSAYVAFHALQAFGYQIISIALWMLAGFIFPVLFVLLMIPLAFVSEQLQIDLSMLDVWAPILFMALFFLPLMFIFGIYWLVSLLGAALVFMGKEFRYPVMGNWLARYLKYAPDNAQNPIDTDAEERWVAGLGHASLSISFWGMIVPFATWLAEKNRSALLRFQSLQALVYQALGVAGYFLAQVCYMASYFIFLGGALLSGFQTEKMGDANIFSGVAILFMGFVCCCSGAMLIATPVYYLLGFFAALRVIGGHSYKYPLLGSFIWNRQNKPVTVLAQVEGGEDVGQ